MKFATVNQAAAMKELTPCPGPGYYFAMSAIMQKARNRYKAQRHITIALSALSPKVISCPRSGS